MQKPQVEATGRADVSCSEAPLRFLGCAMQPSRLPSLAPLTTASDKASENVLASSLWGG